MYSATTIDVTQKHPTTRNKQQSTGYFIDKQVAAKFGIPAAMFLGWINFYQHKNEKEGRNQYEGRTWVYHSFEKLTEVFPCLTIRQLKYVVHKLRKAGVLLVKRFSASYGNQVNYYTIIDPDLFKSTTEKNVKNHGGDKIVPSYKYKKINTYTNTNITGGDHKTNEVGGDMKRTDRALSDVINLKFLKLPSEITQTLGNTLTDEQLNYLIARFYHKLEPILPSISDPRGLLEEVTFSVENARYQLTGVSGFVHAINRCLRLILDNKWFTPRGYYSVRGKTPPRDKAPRVSRKTQEREECPTSHFCSPMAYTYYLQAKNAHSASERLSKVKKCIFPGCKNPEADIRGLCSTHIKGAKNE